MNIPQRLAIRLPSRLLLLMLTMLVVTVGMFFMLNYISNQKLEYALFQKDTLALVGKWRGVVQTTAMLPVSDYTVVMSYQYGMRQITELQQQVDQMGRVVQQAQSLDEGLREDLQRLLWGLNGAILELMRPYADLGDFIAYHESAQTGLLQHSLNELNRRSWMNKRDDDPERLFYLVRMYNNIARYDVGFSQTLEAQTSDIQRKLDVSIETNIHRYEFVQIGLGVSFSLLVILLVTRVIVIYNRTQAAKDVLMGLSMQDVLTELPNRRSLILSSPEYISAAAKDGGGLFLFMIDVDNFKEVNDSLGHAAGDALLRTLAQRIVGILRSPSMAARFGGDEFVVLVPETHQIEEAEAIAQRLLDHISTPISYEGQLLEFTISIGIAHCPTDGDTLEELLQSADMALYQAKNKGKNTYALRTGVPKLLEGRH